MGDPVIGYENLIESASSVSVTSEASGFEKENAYDWLTYDWWKASAAGTVYYTMDLGSAQSADYWACFAHDLVDNSGSIKLQYSSDNFVSDTNDATTAVTPTDSKVIFKTFTSQSARYWRFEVVSSGSASALGVLAFGARMDMPDGMAIGFIPPTMSFADDVTNSTSHGGAFLGRSVLRKGATGSMRFNLMTPAWVRSDWLPFLQHAREKPFFLSWDPDNYSNEAAYCWTDKAITPPAYSHTTYMRAELRFRALTE